MARGRKWSFGKRINDPRIFIPLMALFVVGLFDWRRPLSVRNVDVLMLAASARRSTSSTPARSSGACRWPTRRYSGSSGACSGSASARARRPGYATRWPIWLVAGLAVFALGFRAGLNVWGSNVIDVGYASVVGADRLLEARSPFGNMPQSTGKPCGTKYSDGTYAAYVQTDGACESAVGRGDTYGPVTYYSYMPMTAVLGWSGRWDDLPAAHGTSILFDFLAAAGLALTGWKLGGRRLAVAALFLWATFPFTVYSMSSNTNDAIPAAFLAWGLAALHDAAPARVHARPGDGGEVLARAARAALDARGPQAAAGAAGVGVHGGRPAARAAAGAARARLGPAASGADRAQGRCSGSCSRSSSRSCR